MSQNKATYIDIDTIDQKMKTIESLINKHIIKQNNNFNDELSKVFNDINKKSKSIKENILTTKIPHSISDNYTDTISLSASFPQNLHVSSDSMTNVDSNIISIHKSIKNENNYVSSVNSDFTAL